MFIYLCMPIDKNADYEANTKEMVNLILRDLPENAVVYIPGFAFQGKPLANPTMQSLIAVNYAAMDEADVILLAYKPGVESWGVPQELLYAYENDKLIFVIDQDYRDGVYRWSELPVYMKAFLTPDNLKPWTMVAQILEQMIKAETEHLPNDYPFLEKAK